MCADNTFAYSYSDPSMADHFQSRQSISSSFSSTSSTSSTNDYVVTPASTPPHRGSYSHGYLKQEEIPLQIPTPSTTPANFEVPTGFYDMPPSEEEMLAGYGNQPMIFDSDVGVYSELNNMGYVNSPSVADAITTMLDNHTYASIFGGVRSFEPSSTMNSTYQGPFVVPSQTMAMQSPTRTDSMSSQLQYGIDTPGSACGPLMSTSSTPSTRPLHGPAHTGCVDSAAMSRSRMSERRQYRCRTLPSSMALHLVQSGRAFPSDSGDPSPSPRRRSKQDSSLPGNTSRVPSASKLCPYPGCPKRFQRQEHLKRHEKTHSEFEGFPCQFCVAKPFSRTDNLKSHIKLHTDPNRGPSSRTKYHPGALATYEAMSRKPRKNGVKDEDMR